MAVFSFQTPGCVCTVMLEPDPATTPEDIDKDEDTQDDNNVEEGGTKEKDNINEGEDNNKDIDPSNNEEENKQTGVGSYEVQDVFKNTEQKTQQDGRRKRGKLLKDEAYNSRLQGSAFFQWAKFAKQVSKAGHTTSPGKKRSSAYTDFLKVSVPKLKASNPTMSSRDLLRTACVMWQASKEKEVSLASKSEHVDAKSKQSKKSNHTQEENREHPKKLKTTSSTCSESNR